MVSQSRKLTTSQIHFTKVTKWNQDIVNQPFVPHHIPREHCFASKMPSSLAKQRSSVDLYIQPRCWATSQGRWRLPSDRVCPHSIRGPGDIAEPRAAQLSQWVNGRWYWYRRVYRGFDQKQARRGCHPPVEIRRGNPSSPRSGLRKKGELRRWWWKRMSSSYAFQTIPCTQLGIVRRRFHEPDPTKCLLPTDCRSCLRLLQRPERWRRKMRREPMNKNEACRIYSWRGRKSNLTECLDERSKLIS